MAEKKEFMTYKGKPLVRSGDELYYGSMEDKFVIHLIIKSKKEINGIQVADNVVIQLLATDPDLSPRKRLVKTSEKNGLYRAIDISEVWLKRALKDSDKSENQQ